MIMVVGMVVGDSVWVVEVVWMVAVVVVHDGWWW